MKRFLSLLLAAALLLAPGVSVLGDDSLRVKRAQYSLEINGEAAPTCEVYEINGYNYFKLRDIAYLLNGTGSQFSVEYVQATDQIQVVTGRPYVPVGQELADRGDCSGKTKPSAQTLIINGTLNGWISAYEIGGYNFFKLRDLGSTLGFDVDSDDKTRTMLVRSSDRIDAEETLRYEQVSAAGVTADVLFVNVKNPKVRVQADMVDGTVAARRSFAEIVADAEGAKAVITGNFMNGDSEGNYPVGHVMCSGELKYIGSGYTSFGITADGEVRVGRPSLNVRMRPTERTYTFYNAIGMNLSLAEQRGQLSTIYTPAFGADFEVGLPGNVTVVRAGAVSAWREVKPGERIDIPADGYVLLLSEEYLQYVPGGFVAPAVGEKMELEYYMPKADAEGFSLDGVTQLISGAPRLVKDGAPELGQEPGFDGDRFTDTYAAPRTALGVTGEGVLVFISTSKATIPQLRELMLHLGCTDAVNLDGGASTGLWYNGKTYRTPGRLLATTVSIYVDP